MSESKYKICIIGLPKNDKCTLKSLISMMNDSNIDGVDIEKSVIKEVKPKDIFSSVSPNLEVSGFSREQMDRNTKVDFCGRLGIIDENIDDVSWDEISKETEEESKGKRR